MAGRLPHHWGYILQLTKPAARWAAIAAAAVLVLIGAAWVFRGALADFARQRAIRGLKEYFASDLDLKRMEVSVFPRFAMTGEGLTLHFHGRRDLPPLVSIRRFSGDAGWAGLLTGHIRQVRLEGLEIQLPPKSQQAAGEKPRKPRKIAGFVIDEVIADGTTVRTVPRDAAKTPLVWDIRRLTLYGAGPSSPMWSEKLAVGSLSSHSNNLNVLRKMKFTGVAVRPTWKASK